MELAYDINVSVIFRTKKYIRYRIRKDPFDKGNFLSLSLGYAYIGNNEWVEEYWCLRQILQKDIVNYMFPLFLYIDSEWQKLIKSLSYCENR